MAQKGAAENRSAMQDVLAELDQTRREYAKLSLQLTQQDALVQHLKDTEAKKDQVIAFLQEELTKLNQLYGKESEVQGEEHKTRTLELEHRNGYLEMEVRRLQEEGKINTNFEKDNRQLREALLQHQGAVEKLQTINDELRAKASTEMTDFRHQLESEFKRRLSEAEKKFRAEAYRALTEEAKIALQGNDHLQLVLQRQNDSIEGVLSRCKQLESSHDRLKTEQELAQQNLKQHQNEVQKLRRQLADSKAKNTQLEEALKQRRIERASLELLFLEYEATRKELQRSQNSVRKAQRESERWRSRAIKISSDMGKGDAVQQMEDVSKRQEKIDEHLRKEKVRRERKQRLRQKRADQAMKLEAEGLVPDDTNNGFTTDPTSSDYDTSYLSDNAKGATNNSTASRVNPVDVLAMWNINFEAWQGEQSGEGGGGGGGGGGEASVPPNDHNVNEETASADGDIENTEGRGGGGAQKRYPPAPPADTTHPAESSKPRQNDLKESSSQARVRADRQLSVLSKARTRNVPFPRFYKATGGGGGPRSDQLDESASSLPFQGKALTVVNAEGEFSTRRAGKKYPNVAGGAASAAAPSGNRFFVP